MTMEKYLTDLQCGECGEKFVDRAWYEEDIDHEQGRPGWVLARAGTRGITCPECGCRDVQVMNTRL
jgi:predicted RNA-binding Zn-ribbon protein involved in translation (DUF1610 family)